MQAVFFSKISNGCLASGARQAVGERTGSGGQVTHPANAGPSTGSPCASGDLSTAGGNTTP
jgi:hypothetical protein